MVRKAYYPWCCTAVSPRPCFSRRGLSFPKQVYQTFLNKKGEVRETENTEIRVD
jgi:hypothetical protein